MLLFYVLKNNNNEKPDGIASSTFHLDDFPKLFLHSSTFLLKIRDLHKLVSCQIFGIDQILVP